MSERQKGQCFTHVFASNQSGDRTIEIRYFPIVLTKITIKNGAVGNRHVCELIFGQAVHKAYCPEEVPADNVYDSYLIYVPPQPAFEGPCPIKKNAFCMFRTAIDCQVCFV